MLQQIIAEIRAGKHEPGNARSGRLQVDSSALNSGALTSEKWMVGELSDLFVHQETRAASSHRLPVVGHYVVKIPDGHSTSNLSQQVEPIRFDSWKCKRQMPKVKKSV